MRRVPWAAVALVSVGTAAGSYVARPPAAALHEAHGITVHPHVLRVQLSATAEETVNAPSSGPPSDSPQSPRRNVYVLSNPMYLKKKPRPQPPPPPPARPLSPRSTSRYDVGEAPKSAASAKNNDDDSSPGVAPEPMEAIGSGKPAARRLAQKPDKAKRAGGGGKDGDNEEGPRKGPQRRDRRGGRGLTDSEAMAMARNPRKKGPKQSRNAVAPPSAPVGPAKVTLGDTITVGDLAAALNIGAASVSGRRRSPVVTAPQRAPTPPTVGPCTRPPTRRHIYGGAPS